MYKTFDKIQFSKWINHISNIIWNQFPKHNLKTQSYPFNNLIFQKNFIFVFRDLIYSCDVILSIQPVNSKLSSSRGAGDFFLLMETASSCWKLAKSLRSKCLVWLPPSLPPASPPCWKAMAATTEELRALVGALMADNFRGSFTPPAPEGAMPTPPPTAPDDDVSWLEWNVWARMRFSICSSCWLKHIELHTLYDWQRGKSILQIFKIMLALWHLQHCFEISKPFLFSAHCFHFILLFLSKTPTIATTFHLFQDLSNCPFFLPSQSLPLFFCLQPLYLHQYIYFDCHGVNPRLSALFAIVSS